MDTMISVWTMVEHVRVASGAAELAIFTAILYWFFTSSRVADMLEVVGERVGGWCGRDTSSSLRQAVRARRRHNQYGDVYSKVDADVTARTTSLYRVKEGPVVPAPQPQTRPPAGLACARCAPLSRESWQEPKTTDTGSVINILDIGRQNFANGGVVSRYLCDLAQCCQLQSYDYTDIVPNVIKDENVQRSIEECVQEELEKSSEGLHNGGGDGRPAAGLQYDSVRRRVEAKAYKIIHGISSAMSTGVLRLVAWACHAAVRRVARGGCGTRAGGIARLRRANAAGLPLVFVPLHRSHFDYILVTFALYLTGIRPPLVAAGDNLRIPFFGWFLRGCGAFFIRRRMEGSDYHSDPIYKSALRSYILNGLAAKNNLEFFIEGGRTRTGKPQTPKAGILSLIMEAYLDGTIDDALLVPVTLNYDKLVDGNFVREQLGMPKQMETFWSALRGIWRTLNTNHGSIRVDFNQPISLKELVTSFQKFNHYKAPIESPLTPPNNNLAVNLDRQILYNHSYSSFYGSDVSTDHKIMVEAIGRHLVYDAAQASPLMCTNIVAYVLLTEMRGGGTLQRLQQLVERRAAALQAAGRDLAYSGEPRACLNHALEMLGRGLVRREGGGERALVQPQLSIAASLELAYYANTVVAHYAAPAVIATALETIIAESSGEDGVELVEVRHCSLVAAALQLCAVLSLEFMFCAPCQRIQERLHDAVDALVADEVLAVVQPAGGLEEQHWSRRFAARLDDDDGDDEPRRDPAAGIKYKILNTDAARAERRRLVVSLRPLLEAYAAAARRLAPAPLSQLVKGTLDALTDDFTQNRMIYGEAVSTDAISNCLRLLRQWGVVQLHSHHKQRALSICEPYRDQALLDEVTHYITKFNVDTPLLRDK